MANLVAKVLFVNNEIITAPTISELMEKPWGKNTYWYCGFLYFHKP